MGPAGCFCEHGLDVGNRHGINFCRDGQVRLRHAEHCAVSALLLEDSFDSLKGFDVTRVWVALFLDLDGIEHAVLFEDNVYLAPILVAVIVNVRLFAVVPPALHDFRYDIGLQQFAAQYFFLRTE